MPLRRQANIQIGMGSDTGWLGIPGHGVGVREVQGSNPVGTALIFAPVFTGYSLGTRVS